MASVARCVALAMLAAATVARSGAAQQRGVRFPVASVGDTTLQFLAAGERWIRRDLPAIAVDPRKRDVLVARLRIVGVDSAGRVTALVTGQTTALSREHTVILPEPRVRWYRRGAFWGGLAAGGVLGAIAGGR